MEIQCYVHKNIGKAECKVSTAMLAQLSCTHVAFLYLVLPLIYLVN